MVDQLLYGLSRYELEVELSGCGAQIKDLSFGAFDGNSHVSKLPNSSVTFSAADSGQAIQASEKDVTLATLTLDCQNTSCTGDIELSVNKFLDDYGQSLITNASSATFNCGSSPAHRFTGGNWHLMSVPVAPTSTSCSDVIGDDLPVGRSCSDLLYGPWTGSAYRNPPSDLSPFEGYWLYAPEELTVDVSGTKPASKELKLERPGWFMIGSPVEMPWGDVEIKQSGGSYKTIKNVDFTSSNAPLLDTIYEYDLPGGDYVVISQPDWDDYTILPWKGYWIMVTQEANTPLYLKFEEETPGPPSPPLKSKGHAKKLSEVERNRPSPPPPPIKDSARGPLEVSAYSSSLSSWVTFAVTGEKASSIQALKVEVKTLDGETIFSSRSDSATLSWRTEGVPNGVYLYVGSVKTEGEFDRTNIGKLLVLK